MTFRKRLMVTFATVIVVPMLLFTLSFIALGNYLIGEKGELRGYTSIVGNYDTFDLDAVQAFQKAEQNPDKLQDVDFLDSLASDLRDRNVYLVVRRDEGLYYASNETMAVDDLSYLPEWKEDEASELENGGASDSFSTSHTDMAQPEENAPQTVRPGDGKGGAGVDLSTDAARAEAAGLQQQNQIGQQVDHRDSGYVPVEEKHQQKGTDQQQGRHQHHQEADGQAGRFVGEGCQKRLDQGRQEPSRCQQESNLRVGQFCSEKKETCIACCHCHVHPVKHLQECIRECQVPGSPGKMLHGHIGSPFSR